MDNAAEVMQALEEKGNAQTRKIYIKHGAPNAMFGVKVADLKPIAKKIKNNQDLALELYATGNSDAMYLAGMVADGSQMTKTQLNKWAKDAPWYMISEYSVPGVAHEHADAAAIALKWINSKKDNIAAAGWTTYVGVLATRDDDELNLDEIKELLERVETNIDSSGNRIRYTMNGFVIGVGTYVKPLLKKAKATAKKIGKVDVDMGGTACKVPFAPDYIAKIEKMGRVGKKRKTIKC